MLNSFDPRYTVKTGCHLVLGLYMWYENHRRDNLAVKEGYVVPEAERNKLAEEAGMVSGSLSFGHFVLTVMMCEE